MKLYLIEKCLSEGNVIIGIGKSKKEATNMICKSSNKQYDDFSITIENEGIWHFYPKKSDTSRKYPRAGFRIYEIESGVVKEYTSIDSEVGVSGGTFKDIPGYSH